MYKLKTISVRSLFLVCIIGLYGCAKTSELNNFVDLGKKYDVVIERDYLGAVSYTHLTLPTILLV